MRVLLASMLCLGVIACGRIDEIDAKPEWATLQVVERDYRADRTSAHVILLEKNAFHLVGIRSLTHNTYTWILLDPKVPPMIKQVPMVEYRITADELKSILQTGFVAPAVAAELEVHCSPS
jgi:hypothetical protein